MRLTLLLVFLITFIANAESRIMIMPYSIKSDVKVDSISPGTCIVQGRVFYDLRKPLNGALVATTDFKKQTKTDTAGYFQLVLSDADSSIFFFQVGYQETVIQHDFKSQHLVEIDFFAQSNQRVTTVRKPVIYCYSPTPLSVNLELDFKSDLIFTYPKYDDGWEIDVNDSGISADGSAYPYLFWEGVTDNLTYEFSAENSIEGFVVKTDTIVSFLENSLDALGLNETEKTDFITYWGPKITSSPYAFIQFHTNSWYDENIASITSSPAPENMQRLFMMYSPLEFEALGNFNVKPQVFDGFERNGFTLVEWGGAEIPSSELYSKTIN